MTETHHNFEKLLSDAYKLGLHGSNYRIVKYNQPENQMTQYRLALESPIKEFEDDDIDKLFFKGYKYLEVVVATKQNIIT